MSTLTHRQHAIALSLAFLASIAVAAGARSQTTAETTPIEVQGGTATFDVGTNVPALSVHGKSSALKARGRVRQTGEAPVLEQLTAVVPVKSLDTGMGIRDDHMRKRVFMTGDGQLPDLEFSARESSCARAAANQSTCEVTGDLAIRGVPRPFTITLKVTQDGEAFRAVGDGTVKLSEYGIEQPSQLGVRTDDDVKLRFNFTAKQASAAVGTTGTVR
jgi:polyisoprenoid-binding protein YceI